MQVLNLNQSVFAETLDQIERIVTEEEIYVIEYEYDYESLPQSIKDVLSIKYGA